MTKPHRFYTFRCLQNGVVLIITLLVLIAMMLAAVGLMRSMDTSLLAVSNLSFRQAANHAALTAIEDEIRNLENIAQTDIGSFEANNAAQGYYATIQPGENLKGVPRLLQAINNSGVRNLGEDRFGNTARVVVERLCSQSGIVDKTKCASGGLINAADTQGSTNVANFNPGQIVFGGQNLLPAYRVTARVDGPRNVVSYAQSIITLR